MLETQPEPGQRRSTPNRLFIHVLSYDDLLADCSATFRIARAADTLRLGRATAPCDITLDGELLAIPDPFMSGEHAVIERRGDTDVLFDKGSRNGTWLNGKRILEHRLADSDLIEVGHSLFCYRLIDDALAAAVNRRGAEPCLGPTRTHCPELAALGAALGKIAPSTEPVLILAETGSGKEVAANAIHKMSGRTGAFRAVDCGAIPENLFESTFFGHRKGSFTGAEEHRTGEIVEADGTLFLDEVGNMLPSAQAKLLRTIETGEVTPVGATQSRSVDVRWVAATNRDLFDSGDDFREDLLRRLSGYVARIPPLRRRREDLGVLCAYLLREANAERASITPAAARLLFCGSFTGNVRQLRTTLRSARLLAGADAIDVAHLPKPEKAAQDAPAPGASKPSAAKRRVDADAVSNALTQTDGNVVRAAEVLGAHARQVYRWIEKFGLNVDDFRRKP